jgi:SAM-dependent methyltransferase
MKKNLNTHKEEFFHNRWAKTIDINDLTVYQAFEGPVSPEYRLAIELLGEINNKKILNPGCGAGEEAVYLAKKGANVWAVDISQGMLNVVEQLSKKFKVSGKVVIRKDNVEKLSFKNNTFDLILGNSILHHVSIDRSLPELYRVLKKQGKAVFVEPLGYNPIINYYRKLANLVRTPDEHPLLKNDIIKFKNYFSTTNHYEFHFFTLLIFCFFFLIERVSPNKDRYWKKIIREGKKYEFVFKILYTLDRVILRIFPFLRWLCWVTIIEASKNEKR